MGIYEETLKDIESSLGIVPGFMKFLPPEVLVQEWPTFKKYILGESKIPVKYREMIGLGIAASIKCPYCEFFHLGAARLWGATDEELSELVVITSLTNRWSAILHAQNYDFEKFKREVEQIGDHLQKKVTPVIRR